MKSMTSKFLLPTILLALCIAVVPCAGAWAVSGDLQSADTSQDALTVQATTAKTNTANPTKAEINAFKKSTADFSMKLFAKSVAAKGMGANVTISPYSVLNALAMTQNGAAGKTSAEFRRVLANGATTGTTRKMLSWYGSKLSNTKLANISNANAIWYDDDPALQMKKGFINLNKKYHKAEITAADFADPATVSTINNWVAAKTHNMIKRIVDALQPEDRIALVNALYFDAKWKKPFEKSDVGKAKFTTAGGKKKTVDMMFGTESTYIEGYGATGFIKPYARGYSYVALLPNKEGSLKKFVSSLTGDKFRKLMSGATKQTVRIAMPKYTVDYTNEAMEEQLKAMGIRTAFTRSANFSKMATDKRGNLFIGSVVHKTKVQVDENGTKAAAATAVVMKNGSAFFGDVKTVRLDRPFVYAIIDNNAKLPIFIGTVNTIGK